MLSLWTCLFFGSWQIIPSYSSWIQIGVDSQNAAETPRSPAGWPSNSLSSSGTEHTPSPGENNKKLENIFPTLRCSSYHSLKKYSGGFRWFQYVGTLRTKTIIKWLYWHASYSHFGPPRCVRDLSFWQCLQCFVHMHRVGKINVMAQLLTKNVYNSPAVPILQNLALPEGSFLTLIYIRTVCIWKVWCMLATELHILCLGIHP